RRSKTKPRLPTSRRLRWQVRGIGAPPLDQRTSSGLCSPLGRRLTTPIRAGDGSSANRYLVHADLLMVSFKAFELCDYHLAGWDQCVTALVRERARQKDLGKPRRGCGLLARIVERRSDHVLNHFFGALDAICWDAAAMSVT